jgi:hypothetical protein
MKFTLRYRGVLPPASGREKRVPQKQQLRREFHAQLSELWRQETVLLHYAKFGLPEAMLDHRRIVLPANFSADFSMHCAVPVGPFKFVPLVTRVNGLGCRLSIKFLRHGHAGEMVGEDGDLDNRLKVLFDSLRMPLSPEEMPPASEPIEGDYFYCLLEDDCLITGYSIRSGRLLTPEKRRSDVDLLIDVDVRTLTPNDMNLRIPY